MNNQLFPKISVVTPNFNQGFFLEQTIKSVLEQNYPNLEYIIMDAGSTDNSLDIIRKYEDKLFYWESKKDYGMYDAINRGFTHSSGEIMCWINSDDVLWEGSLNYVAELFSSNSKLHWLQGFPSVIDENGKLLYQRAPVFSKFFFYSMQHMGRYEFIQQESTFWSRHLWKRAGSTINLNYTLAADFDLWMRFFKYETLYCTKKQLGAFRKRENQQSENILFYLQEANDSLNKNKVFLSLYDKTKLFVLLSIQKIGRVFPVRHGKKFISLISGKPKFI
ncbi:MAG: glycosyltransferase family 2 protein [Bacteroidetes bacterium]|nr:glycosyltransferase family 2 protein [Bacteroidota bacterium]